jgi:hypothetical protein
MRHDPGQRRKAQRSGREKGCWVYIPAEMLQAAGYGEASPAPHYRLWGGRRGRLVVTLYPTP